MNYPELICLNPQAKDTDKFNGVGIAELNWNTLSQLSVEAFGQHSVEACFLDLKPIFGCLGAVLQAIVVKAFDDGSKARAFGHALVAGIDRAPLKVTRRELAPETPNFKGCSPCFDSGRGCHGPLFDF